MDKIAFIPSGKKPAKIEWLLVDYSGVGAIWNIYELFATDDYDRHWQTHPVEREIWVGDNLYYTRWREKLTFEQTSRIITQYDKGYQVLNVDLRNGNVRR